MGSHLGRFPCARAWEIREAKEALRVLESAREARRIITAPFAGVCKSGGRQ